MSNFRRKKMKKYQYKTHYEIHNTGLEQLLNNIGSQGWKVIHFHWTDRENCRFVTMREVEEEKKAEPVVLLEEENNTVNTETQNT